MKQLLILIAYFLNWILRLKSSDLFRQTIQISCSEQFSTFDQDLLKPNGGVGWKVYSYLALVHQTACREHCSLPLRRRRDGVHGSRRRVDRKPPRSSDSDQKDLRCCSSFKEKLDMGGSLRANKNSRHF